MKEKHARRILPLGAAGRRGQCEEGRGRCRWPHLPSLGLRPEEAGAGSWLLWPWARRPPALPLSFQILRPSWGPPFITLGC